MPDLAVGDHQAALEIREGLARLPRSLPTKLFYDREGSRLFDLITRQPEYYLTETEVGILESSVAEFAGRMGPGAVLAELASGSARKARILLEALEAPAAYVPVDISEEMLAAQARAVARDFPALRVLPMAADFSRDFAFPMLPDEPGRLTVFYAGSSIGNHEPDDARALLARVARATGPGALLLLGVDRKKDRSVLERAYNDEAGVTAAFNRNILNNVNALADGDFDPKRFDHLAFYNRAAGRIEMHLESVEDQTVSVSDETHEFRAGETIHTENCYKYAIADAVALAAPAWRPVLHRSDPKEWFTVFLLEATGEAGEDASDPPRRGGART